MIGQFERAIRALITGSGFALFGIGGALMTITVFPLMALLSPDRDVLRRRVQRTVQLSFAGFMFYCRLVGAGQLVVEGADKLAGGKGALVLANHPTLLDVVGLISVMRQADCVVKKDLWSNPFLGGVVRAAGYIRNDSDPQQFIGEVESMIGAGRKLVVFPEGTRSRPGQGLKFQRGTAHLLLACRAEVIPVTISCEPPTLMKHTRWYQVPERPWIIRIRVHDRVLVENLVDTSLSRPLAARQLTRVLQVLFENRLKEHEVAG